MNIPVTLTFPVPLTIRHYILTGVHEALAFEYNAKGLYAPIRV